jgi:hypothetical protein
MTAHADELDAQDSAALTELGDKIRELGLAHDDTVLLPPGQSILSSSGTCVTAEEDRSVTVKACSGGSEQTFVMDARGAIHPLTHLEQCVTFGSSSSAVALGNCDMLKSSQSWLVDADQTIASAVAANQVFDDAGGTLYAYGAHGGDNQKWSGLTRSGSVLLATLSAYNLPRLALVAN